MDKDNMDKDNISDNTINTFDSENIGSVESNEEDINSLNIPILNINPSLTNNYNIANLFFPLINGSLNINLQNNNQPINENDQEDYIDDNQETIDIHEEHEYNENEHEYNENEHNEHEYNENEHNHNFPYYFEPYNMVSNMVNQNPNYDNEINNKIIEVMNDASNMLFTSSEELINIINMSYLTNLQYSDGLSNIIIYTIRSSFRDTPQYEIKDVVAGILTYSLSDINVVFNENYDLIYSIIQQELKRIYSRSYIISLLANLFNVNNVNNPQMENVKLTIKPEIIENIPKKKFKDYDQKIKDMNSKCTICQVGFENNDETRILPCDHTYHVDCIDNWLTNYNYMCPCCREPAGEHFANLS